MATYESVPSVKLVMVRLGAEVASDYWSGWSYSLGTLH